ncbi:hypothetical protein FAF44_49430 [Nonomuraea sp. MG754425]|uniref:hypothetical protein n=1 Tax=Nonomuraea sp. MG754425 TaxID=2570319 RepID=UPI001F1C9D54|nr:hypothetical protein [Nonomuraea sp. MG754425]MCF6476312.1 hypothetical protein [Nonomuraea sp. MG754425]
MSADFEGDRFSDAIRLLLLIAAVADPIGTPVEPDVPANAVAVMHAESRLQKLDFWLRNPDYLADELLNDYERSGETILLDLAGQILDSDEPEVCAIPMLRYLFGAFEYLDRALSVLAAPRLVVVRQRRSQIRVIQDSYYLTSKGRQIADQATAQFPELAWYTERALLVRALAEATGHTALALRKRQYLQRDYAQTPLGEIIPSIADRTRKRLTALREETSWGAVHE